MTLRNLAASAVLLASTALVPAAAQNAPEFVRDIRTVFDRMPDDLRADGLKLGTFVLRPRLTVQAEHDDNVFAETVNGLSDTILSARPVLVLESDWKKHEVTAEAFYRYQTFLDGTNPDISEGGANIFARYDASDSFAMNLFAAYVRDVADRADTDGALSASDRLTARGGFVARWSGGDIRASAEFRRLDFLEAFDDDRDRDEFMLTARLRLATSEIFTPFLQADHLIRDYRDARDDAGFNRDSTRTGVLAGVRVRLGDDARLSAAAGFLRSDFDDARFAAYTAFVAEAELTWNFAEDWSLVARLDRNENATTVTGASSRIQSIATLRLEHAFTNRLRGFAEARFIEDRFEGITRTDETAIGVVGIEYLAAKGIELFADMRIVDRDSTLVFESYDRTSLRAGLSIAF